MSVPTPVQSPAIQHGADLMTELLKSTIQPYTERLAQLETELVRLHKAESEAQEKTNKIQSYFQVKLSEVQTEAFDAKELASRYEKRIAQLSTLCGLAPLLDDHPVHFNEDTSTLLHDILLETRNFTAALQGVDTLPTSIPEPSSALSALRVFLNQLRSSNAVWKAKFEEMKNANSTLEDQLNSLSKDCKDSQAESSHLQIINATWQAKYAKLNEAHVTLAERLNSLSKEHQDSFTEWKTKNEALLKDRDEQAAKLKIAEGEVDSHRHSVSILRNDLSDVTAARIALQQEGDGLRLKLRNDSSLAQSTQDKLQEELKQEKEQRGALAKLCLSLTDSVTALKQQMAQVQSDSASSMKAHIKESQEKESILNQRIKTLTEEHRSAMGSSQSLIDDLFYQLTSRGISTTIFSSAPPPTSAPSSSWRPARPDSIHRDLNIAGGFSTPTVSNRPVVPTPVSRASNTALRLSTATSTSPYNVPRVERITPSAIAKSVATTPTSDLVINQSQSHPDSLRTDKPFNPPTAPRTMTSVSATSRSQTLKRPAAGSDETVMKKARTSPSAPLSSSSSTSKRSSPSQQKSG